MTKLVFGSELANTIAQNEPELLPCPFCGGRPTFVEPDKPRWFVGPEMFARRPVWQIICTDCQVYPEPGERTEVIQHWNTRWEEGD